MTANLPALVAAYLDADRSDDLEAFDAVFAPDAVVTDENRTIRGIAAIKTWKADAREKYTYEVSPLAVTEDGDTIDLSALLTGNFSGSPAVLHYTFVVENGLITSLEIV